MEVVCIQDFGNCKVGDIRDIPDDAAFSEIYFARADYDKDHVPAALTEKEANLTAETVEPRGDAPDEAEERALADAGKGKSPARKPRSKASADNNEEKSEG